MAGSLLEYQGNAGLGVGTNPDVSVGPSDQVLSQLHETSRDIMLMDNQRNIMKYQQKIKDRDQLEEMITKGMVSAGDIDQRYRPMYEKARDKVVQQYLAMHGDLNDEAGYLKLDAAIKDANDIANHAQAKTLGMQKLQQEKAAQTTKTKQDEYQRWIDQQDKRPFWDQVDPYQQLHDFDMGSITAAKGLTRTITDPNQPLQSVDETTFNYADIFADKWDHWLQQDAASEDYTTFRDKYQGVNPQKLSMSIDNINARLKAYNETFGYQPGMRGYAAPVNAEVAGNQVAIKDNPVEFAAKYALATQQAWRTTVPGKFNTGAANYEIGKARLAIEARKANIEAAKLGIDRDKANAYVAHLKAQDKKITGNEQQIAADAQKKWGQITNGVQFQAVTKKATKGNLFWSGKPAVREDITDVSSLPESFQYLSGPVIDPKNKKVTVQRMIPYTTDDGRSYYKNIYVDPATGTDINVYGKEWMDGYRASMKQGYLGSYSDYLKENLAKGRFQLVLEGQFPKTDAKGNLLYKGGEIQYEPGRATYESFYNSERLINDEATRGKANVVDEPPPESTPGAPSDTGGDWNQ